MIDLMIFISLVFFATVIGFAVEYYKHIVKVKEEYEKAKAAFNEVILSFTRELERTTESLETVTYKAEASATRSTEALSKAEGLEEKLKALEAKVKEASESSNKTLARISDVEKQFRDAAASHQEIISKVSVLEEKLLSSSIPPLEAHVETVIPIKKEKALAHLTETELAVLEMLAVEGPKTAPEIKDKIKLSREHTARLMKKLYEEGYLERDASKIPFKYSVKKELEKILRKTESEAV